MTTISRDELVKKISAAMSAGKDSGGYDTLFDILAHTALKVIGESLPKRPDSIYSKCHLDNWPDRSFAEHSAATRKTTEWLIELEATLAVFAPSK